MFDFKQIAKGAEAMGTIGAQIVDLLVSIDKSLDHIDSTISDMADHIYANEDAKSLINSKYGKIVEVDTISAYPAEMQQRSDAALQQFGALNELTTTPGQQDEEPGSHAGAVI
jgi:hypothetical protein